MTVQCVHHLDFPCKIPFRLFSKRYPLTLRCTENTSSAGVPGAWGCAIATFTIAVKAATYPLNYKQMASTMAMQKLSVCSLHSAVLLSHITNRRVRRDSWRCSPECLIGKCEKMAGTASSFFSLIGVCAEMAFHDTFFSSLIFENPKR